MRTPVLACALSLLSSVALADVLPSRPADDGHARAVSVGKQMWNALGGDDGWNHARYLRFDFVVERGGKRALVRSHYWDRFSGRYRVDGTDEKTGPWSVYFNVNTRTGEAWVGGKKVTDAAQLKKMLDDGYGAF